MVVDILPLSLTVSFGLIHLIVYFFQLQKDLKNKIRKNVQLNKNLIFDLNLNLNKYHTVFFLLPISAKIWPGSTKPDTLESSCNCLALPSFIFRLETGTKYEMSLKEKKQPSCFLPAHIQS